ncbi:MAG: DUF1801 domain-containing protein [Betaproteobacteria bacterium]|nr:DUF1801 domain-containing protein [Betaproteobacteria bacterium]
MAAVLRFDGAVERDPAIDLWLDSHPAHLGVLAKRWFDRIRACGPDVRELMHDGCATACIENAPFAYVGVYRTHLNVGFFQGAALADPAGLLEGSGKRMRHAKLKPGSWLDEAGLEALIDSAYRDIAVRLKDGHPP